MAEKNVFERKAFPNVGAWALCFALAAATGCQGQAGAGAADKSERKIKALVLTGQSNQYHNWVIQGKMLKQTLEKAGIFKVDMVVSPAKGQDMSGFKPDFAPYEVLVVDYEGDDWPQETQKAFVEYVKNGGGVVIVHATDNAFPKWEEFNEIIGVGGWGGRNEKWGPMVRWRDGKVEYDNSPGSAGTHPPAHDYQVINRNTEHPITKGLPGKWMHPADELYSKLRGPAKNLTVLSTAYCDPKRHGTGEHEPVLFTIEYGKGRVFHTVLGHAGPQDKAPIRCYDCVGFIVTLQRGAEWAATGKVTQKVPEDFPTADKVSVRSGYSALEG